MKSTYSVAIIASLGWQAGMYELFMEFPALFGTAEVVNGAVACGCDDPPSGIRRNMFLAPPVAGNNERILDSVLCKSDITEHAYQGGHGLAIRLTEHTLNFGRLVYCGDRA